MSTTIIKSLHYELQTAETVTYKNPPPVNINLASYKAILDKGKLKIEINKSSDDLNIVKEEIELLLRSWEIHCDLLLGYEEMRFKFSHAELEETDDKLGKTRNIKSISAVASISVSTHAILNIERNTYPVYPANFYASPDCETLFFRFRRYVDHKETITNMAYFCLSLLGNNSGGRKDAANKYEIEFDVLNELGKLSTIYGDVKEARKIGKNWTGQTLSGNQKVWIEEVIKRIILRVGEYDHDPNQVFNLIRMSDLPKLI